MEEKPRVNYLGIDWGEAKIGLALAFDETRLALPLRIIPNDHSLLPTLLRLIEEEGVGTVIIGLPSFPPHQTAHSIQGEASREHPARRLGERLGREANVAVKFVDEIFTTKIAREKLREVGRGARDDDAEAAKVLLEEWLDTKHP